MALAIFDLDKTLIGGDSDFLWGEFLSEIGAVDVQTYQQKNQVFFDQYVLGKLDIDAYLQFCLKPLSKQPMEVLGEWHKRFMREKISPIFLPKAQDAVNKHRDSGDTLLAITATNRFIAAPIVAKYGIKNLLASDPEIKNGRYSGKVLGVPCFQTGKIQHLKHFLEKTGENLTAATFYSDSHNDLPLLELVDNPVVVNGDKKLSAIAQQRGWKTLNWL